VITVVAPLAPLNCFLSWCTVERFASTNTFYSVLCPAYQPKNEPSSTFSVRSEHSLCNGFNQTGHLSNCNLPLRAINHVDSLLAIAQDWTVSQRLPQSCLCRNSWLACVLASKRLDSTGTSESKTVRRKRVDCDCGTPSETMSMSNASTVQPSRRRIRRHTSELNASADGTFSKTSQQRPSTRQ